VLRATADYRDLNRHSAAIVEPWQHDRHAVGR
jgi:hypothetical protein